MLLFYFYKQRNRKRPRRRMPKTAGGFEAEGWEEDGRVVEVEDAGEAAEAGKVKRAHRMLPASGTVVENPLARRDKSPRRPRPSQQAAPAAFEVQNPMSLSAAASPAAGHGSLATSRRPSNASFVYENPAVPGAIPYYPQGGSGSGSVVGSGGLPSPLRSHLPSGYASGVTSGAVSGAASGETTPMRMRSRQHSRKPSVIAEEGGRGWRGSEQESGEATGPAAAEVAAGGTEGATAPAAASPTNDASAAPSSFEDGAAFGSLPPGWVAKFSATKGKHYFFEAATKTSVWRLDKIPGYAPPTPSVAAAAAAAERSGGAEASAAAPLPDAAPPPQPPPQPARPALQRAASIKLVAREWAVLKAARDAGRLAGEGGGLPEGWEKSVGKDGAATFLQVDTGRVASSMDELLGALGASAVQQLHDGGGGAAAAAAVKAVAAAAAPASAAAPLPREAALAAEAALPPLPQGWVVRFSESKGKVFYFHTATGASAWKREKISAV